MATIGIDIGTSSVRLCYNDDERGIFITNSSDITIYRNNNYITQSSVEIYSKILNLLKELPQDYKAISIDATCSMVVLEKLVDNGILYLKPFSVDYNNGNLETDIILWMDNRAIQQLKELNNVLLAEVLNSLGGSIIPEMGLSKLKWLTDHYLHKELIVWEMYDWFSYLLLVGGFNNDGLVTYIKSNNTFRDDSQALDGSIKGWPDLFLNSHGMRFEVGGADFNLPDRGSLYPLGFPLGKIHSSVNKNEAILCNGCIDCYAGWVSTVKDEKFNNNTITMVAGTSTCFLFSTDIKINPIKGIWGPFKQLLNNEVSIYEFGQPATGKLFETLFEQYEETIKRELNLDISNGNLSEVFSAIEEKTAKLEAEYDKPMPYIIKDYFYYGDIYGNRSPYNDYRMSEMIIDGVNSNPPLVSILNSKCLLSLTIRYNLALEFLCFQTKQILNSITLNGAPQIDSIILTGSQAKNARFKSMLAEVLDITVTSASTLDSKFNCVKGASIISLIGYRLNTLENSCSYSDAFSWATSQPRNSTTSLEESGQVSTNNFKCGVCPSFLSKKILDTKYRIYLNMCESQRHYRTLMNE